MNRNIIGLANEANAVFIGATLQSTHSIGPKREVTGIGTGSVIHQMATRDMMASSLCCAASSPAIGKNQTNNAQIGPNMAPTIWRFLSNEVVFIFST